MNDFELPEIPKEDEVTLNPSTTALIIVDMQNDFAHPEGSLYAEEASRVVPNISRLLESARTHGARVVYTQDWHGEDDPEFAIWGEHAKAGTWGAEIVEGLEPRGDEVRIRKLRYDAFYGTSLDHLLRQWGVSHVLMTGTVANICVLHTAGSAALRYYEVVAAGDAIAAVTDFDKMAALRQITFLYRGRVTSSAGVNFAP